MTPSIGLIGCGTWGRLILRDLIACGAKVSVVAPSEKTRTLALDSGAASACAGIAELGRMEGFVVATPSITHAAIVDQLLPFGKPVFVEKPMATDLASAQRIAQAGKGRLFVMQKWRYHRGIEYIRARIAAGDLGAVRAIRLIRWGWGLPHPDVNSIWHLMPHDLAITLHWLGYVPPLRSVALTTPLAFDSGLIAHLGGQSHPAVSIEMSTVSPVHRRCFAAIGSKASMELGDSYAPEVVARHGMPGDLRAREERVPIPQDMPLLAEIRAFLEHLRGGPPPMTDAAEDLAIVERLAEIDAAARAAAEDR
jgi:predicted dehydrogenase